MMVSLFDHAIKQENGLMESYKSHRQSLNTKAVKISTTRTVTRTVELDDFTQGSLAARDDIHVKFDPDFQGPDPPYKAMIGNDDGEEGRPFANSVTFEVPSQSIVFGMGFAR